MGCIMTRHPTNKLPSSTMNPFRGHFFNIGVSHLRSGWRWVDGPAAVLAASLHWVLLVHVLLLNPRVAQAQAVEPLNQAWRWVLYTTESGLPSDRVLNVVESTTGVLWAQTGAGLA